MPKSLGIALCMIMLLFCGGAEAIAVEQDGLPVADSPYSTAAPPAESAVKTVAEVVNNVVNLEMNGVLVAPEAPPYITADGHTMVPLRFISDYAGAETDWLSDSRTAVVLKDGTRMELVIGSAEAYVNGVATQLDAPAAIYNGRTMVPARFILENLGAEVRWDGETRTVHITLEGGNYAEPEPEPQPVVTVNDKPLGAYYFDANSLVMLQTHYAELDFVSNFSHKLNADGSISSKSYTSYWQDSGYAIAQREGIEKLLLVTDFGDPDAQNQTSGALLSSPTARAAAVENLVQLVNAQGMDGVEVDFEVIESQNRDDFVAFIRDLKTGLGAGKIVAVSLPPRRYASETYLDKWDYAGLAQVADRLHIMMYDQHHGNSESPGPVAGVDWMQASLDYLVQVVPREKLFIMLGAYGRSWGVNGRGVSVNLPTIRQRIEEEGQTVYRDPASGVPYLRWTPADGIERQIWFEDAQSMAQKTALAREYGVGGLGVWRMGNIPDDVWQAIVENWRNY